MMLLRTMNDVFSALCAWHCMSMAYDFSPQTYILGVVCVTLWAWFMSLLMSSWS